MIHDTLRYFKINKNFAQNKYDYQILFLKIPKFWYKLKKLKKSEKLFANGTENSQILNIGTWYRTNV